MEARRDDRNEVASGVRLLLARIAPVGIALWTGAVLTIAFLAAPLVFGAVPEFVATKDQAARIIGPAFGRVDLAGIVAALLALWHLCLLGPGPGLRWRRVLVIAMLVAAATDAFWLAPAITERREPLGTYHGAATILWMLILLGGLALMLVGLTPRSAKAER